MTNHKNWRAFDFETFGPLRQDRIYFRDFTAKFTNRQKRRVFDSLLLYALFLNYKKLGYFDAPGKWTIYYRVEGLMVRHQIAGKI